MDTDKAVEGGALRRPLSKAEQAGWRQSWDGWAICRACIDHILSDPAHAAKAGLWPVPAGYSTPIKEQARCYRCSTTAAPTDHSHPENSHDR